MRNHSLTSRIMERDSYSELDEMKPEMIKDAPEVGRRGVQRSSTRGLTVPSTKELAREGSSSPLRTYQELAVGSRSWWTLLRYEIVASWGSLLPGALGLAFRRLFWPSLFGRIGKGTVWGRNVVVRHPANMWIGNGVLVDDDCFFDAKGCEVGQFRIDDSVVISRGCHVTGKHGSVHLGPRVNVGSGCMILSVGGITVGADTMFAGNCYVGGGTYDADSPLDRPMNQRPRRARPVEIGEDCWLGAGVVVIEGVKIGRGSVIGAGSIVTRDIPPYSIAVGVPARVRRQRKFAPSEA